MYIHLDARMYFHKHIKPGQRRHPEPRPADADRRHDQQLMGLAGRFARRVRGSASGARHRVSGCGVAERRHGITEEHLRAPRGVGVLEILVPRAPTTVWQLSRCNRALVTAQVGLLTCAGLPHRRAGAAGWRRSVHKYAPPGYLGKFPQGRHAAHRHARSDCRPTACSTRYRHLSQICAPVSAGSMPTVTVSALPSGYDAASSAIQAAGGAVHRDGATSAADGSAPGTAVTPSPPQPLGWLRPWS